MKNTRSENILFGTVTTVTPSVNRITVTLNNGNTIRCTYNPDDMVPIVGYSAVIGLKRNFSEFYVLDITPNIIIPNDGAVFEVGLTTSEWDSKLLSLRDMYMVLQAAFSQLGDFSMDLSTLGLGIPDISMPLEAYLLNLESNLGLDLELIQLVHGYKDCITDLQCIGYSKNDFPISLEAAAYNLGDFGFDISAYSRIYNNFGMSLEAVSGTKSFTLTIDNTNIDSTLTNYPIMVVLSSSCGTGSFDATDIFDEIGSSYLKLHVKDSGDNDCYVEVQKWDDSAEEAILWVKVPSIASGDTTSITMEYGSTFDDNTTYVGLIGSTPGQNVWDSNFMSVYHFDGTESGVTFTDDSTSNGNDLTDHSTSDSVGKIGRCRLFGSDSIYLSITADDFILTSYTAQCWYKGDGTTQQAYATFLNKEATYQSRNWWCCLWTSTYNDHWRTSSGGSIDVDLDCGSNQVDDDAWHLHIFRFNNSTGYAYGNIDNDISVSSSGHSTPDASSNPFYIGRAITASRYFKGAIDEVRISDISRSDAWVKADYHSMTDNLIAFS